MNALIFGATGFIGQELVKHLLTKNYQITIITRNKQKAKKIFPSNVVLLEWPNQDLNLPSTIPNSFDAIINLAGENIASSFWTKKRKAKILHSRVKMGEKIIEAIKKGSIKPEILIQASATGYYGFDIDKNCSEDAVNGKGFLAEVCKNWEESTEKALSYGIKASIIRTGLVLGKNGGIYPKLLKPIKYFAGANWGKGANWVSWIHIEDEIRAIEFILRNKLDGIFNLTSPTPVLSKNLNRLIAKKTNRPILITIPSSILKLIAGDMAKELLLSNQKVIPNNLLKKGFKFNYPTIEETITNLTS